MRYWTLLLAIALGVCASAHAGPVLSFEAGEHILERPLVLTNGTTVRGISPAATVLVAGGAMEAVLTNSDPAAGNSGIVIQDLTIDCRNRADFGLRLIRTAKAELRNVAVRNCRRDGARLSGNGVRTRGFLIDNLTAENNGADGLIVLWAMRDGRYANIFAEGNGRHGVTFDHSEFTATNVVARNNRASGVFLRNLFATTLNGITATHNGEHGILVQGWVVSTGNGWRAQSNGKRERGTYDDIFFSADDSLSYGATRAVSLNGVVTGDFGELDDDANIRHGIRIEAGVGDVVINGAVYGQTIGAPLCRADCRAGSAETPAPDTPPAQSRSTPPVVRWYDAETLGAYRIRPD